MGKIDAVMCTYMSDRNRMADLFNGAYFQGNQMIRPEDIEDYEGKYPSKKRRSGNVRYRDIVKKMKNGGSLRVLAIENQNCVDYIMPFRCMEYDTLEYRRQIDNRVKKNKTVANWNNRAEFLCGVRKDDRFAPVYTICLYHGKEKWDGPRSLRDLMDFGPDHDKMSHFFVDYPMKLFCVNEAENFDCFQTELREFFTMLSCRNDVDKLEKLSQMEQYKNVSGETAETIAVVMGWPEPEKISMKYGEKGKGVNMCEALEQLVERGVKKGKEQNMRDMILKMYEAGIDSVKISQITGKTPEEVQKLVDQKNTPEE